MVRTRSSRSLGVLVRLLKRLGAKTALWMQELAEFCKSSWDFFLEQVWPGFSTLKNFTEAPMVSISQDPVEAGSMMKMLPSRAALFLIIPASHSLNPFHGRSFQSGVAQSIAWCCHRLLDVTDATR